MAEQKKDKSLDDQLKEAELAIKEAELAKLKSEDEKLKEETALVRKQVNEKWYAGKKLAVMATGVLIFVALYEIFDGIFLAPARKQNQTVEQTREMLASLDARLLDARIDSLNREKTKISTTIDSLKIRTKISAVFGDLDSLKYANVLKHYKTIKANDYYDSRLNPDGGGIENELDVRDVDGGTVIYDAATELTWQGGSEFSRMDWIKAKAYVDTLSYAGHNDWRLPTLEEVMSLMEPKTIENELHGAPFNELHVDARFRDTPDIWTADAYDASVVWSVFFVSGRCEAQSCQLQ